MAATRSGSATVSQVVEGGGEPARHLRRARAGEADLVERQVHVGVPVHVGTTRRTVPVASPCARREGSARELAQAVVQAVDGLHRGGRVENGDSASERSAMSTSMRKPYATSWSSVRSSAETTHAPHVVVVDGVASPSTREQRRAGRHEVAERGTQLEHAVGLARDLDEPLVVEVDDARRSGRRR